MFSHLNDYHTVRTQVTCVALIRVEGRAILCGYFSCFLFILVFFLFCNKTTHIVVSFEGNIISSHLLN